MIQRRTIVITFIVIVSVLFLVIPKDQGCVGDARCIQGQVTEIIDGNTIKVDDQSILLALSFSPELYEENGADAKNYLEKICPIGSRVLVDEDDGQTTGSQGRVIGMIRCNALIINEAMLEENFATIPIEFCSFSEFSERQWAQNHGC